MKASLVLRRFLLASSLLAAANSAHAQTSYFWDADGDTSAATGGSGTWDTGSSLWRNGTATGTLEQWPTTDPSTAYAQLAGTAGTLTLNSDSVNLNLNRIVFGTTGYEIKGPVSGTATLSLSGTAPTITMGDSISATISAKISGSTGLNKTGVGTLNLSGANTYSGTTSVNGGSLTISGDHSGATGGWSVGVNAAASALTFASGSTISVGAGNDVTTVAGNGTASAQRVIAVNGAVTSSSTSDVTIRGRNTLSINNGGSWTMQGGTLSVSVGNSGFSSNLNVNAGGSFTYSGNNTIIVADATGSGAGSATLNLRGTFTTTRGFINTGGGAGSGTSNIIFEGGTLKISNDITSIFTQDTQPFNISVAAGGGVIDTNTYNTATSVGITGTGGLTKKGAGKLTLSGTSTYEGATLVSAGTLLVNGALANGAVTVDPLASIGGTGSIGGSLTVAANSFLNVVDINDPLAVSGTITFGSGFGIANLTGIDWDSLNLDSPYTLISTAQTFGTGNIADFGLANAVDVGTTGRQAYFANGSLAVVIIPEPSSALLGGLGLLALLRRRRAA